MKLSRRSILSLLFATAVQVFLPKRSTASSDDIRHILPAVTSDTVALSVSVGAPRQSLHLETEEGKVAGVQMDSLGRFWSFRLAELSPSTSYTLQLSDENGLLGSSWPLKTFPTEESMPDSFKVLAFTCAGGADGFGTPSRQFFKPHAFRRKIFEEGLSRDPDAAVAIGDHVYWDLRGGNMPAVGRNSRIIKLLAGWYLRFVYGQFDRAQPVLGTENERVLTRVGDEQIAALYGTLFRSTPIFFVSDDHDYFENDDAEEDLVTFPADEFSRDAFNSIARLYYPPLPDGPSSETNRAFGLLKYGQLFEAPLLDCAGHLSVDGEDALLFPKDVELWLKGRVETSSALHFALVPSHPMGWTAGKWREWYPDVVAERGYTGVVVNSLMGEETTGVLTADAQKYLWAKGWWNQHQRVLGMLSKRAGSRFILSGDIHAQGAVKILASGESEVVEAPVTSVLVGPVSTSDATWPSAARGISAARPRWLTTQDLVPLREVNGCSLLEVSADGSARVQLLDCGGFDRSLGENGRVLSTDSIEISGASVAGSGPEEGLEVGGGRGVRQEARRGAGAVLFGSKIDLPSVV